MPIQTRSDLDKLGRREIVDGLRRGAVDGADMRAAVELLVGYNEGELLACPGVRRHVVVWDVHDGRLRVEWPRLYVAVAEGDDDLDELPQTARHVLLLACALKSKVPIDTLGRTLTQLSDANALVAYRALGIALGVRDSSPAARLARRDDQIARLRELCYPDDAAGGAVYVRLADDEPVDVEGGPLPPALAVHVVDVLAIIDGPPNRPDPGEPGPAPRHR